MGAPFPSTYKQVVENMKRINEIVTNYVQHLVDTIFSPTAWSDGSTDVKFDPTDNKLKVIGTTITSDNPSVQSGPSEYFRNITWEVKQSSAMGLSGLPNVGDYVTIMTVAVPNHPIWQVAYSDNRMATYFRRANDDLATWAKWDSVGRKQFVESSTQPAANEQDIGDYWVKPVEGGHQLYRKSGESSYTQIFPQTNGNMILVQNSSKSLNTKLDELDDAISQAGGDLSAHNTDPTAHPNLYIHAGQKSGTTLGANATAEGVNSAASGAASHVEGSGNSATASYAHAEGLNTTASFDAAHAEGNGTSASGPVSHAEGQSTVASGTNSHAEGSYTVASAIDSHAEGSNTTSDGGYSHAEGSGTIASGPGSHAEGLDTEASSTAAHAEGIGTIAQRKSQHVFGEYNKPDTTGSTTIRGTYVEIVGNGSYTNSRSNARTLDWSGNETLAGKLTVGAAPTSDMDVATKQYTDSSITNASNTTKQYTDDSVTNLRNEVINGTIGGAVFYGTTPPSNTRALWVDTTPSTGGLKYHNGTAWVSVPVAYVEE